MESIPEKRRAALQLPSSTTTRRPSTGNISTGRARGPPRPIHEIVNNDSGKNQSSADLLTDLVNQVRKVVSIKRGEFDKLKFNRAKKVDDLDKIRLVLRDLEADSVALGFDKYQEKERLQPIHCVSRRPLYSKHTVIIYWRVLKIFVGVLTKNVVENSCFRKPSYSKGARSSTSIS